MLEGHGRGYCIESWLYYVDLSGVPFTVELWNFVVGIGCLAAFCGDWW